MVRIDPPLYSNMSEVANVEKVMFLGLHFLWEVKYFIFYCVVSFLFALFNLINAFFASFASVVL